MNKHLVEENQNETSECEAESWGRPPNRREAAVASIASALIVPNVLSRVAHAAKANNPASQHKFFTAREFDTLDELADIIIPTDSHSQGAKAAEVAKDLDNWLGGLLPRIPDQAATQKGWKSGLREVDRLSQKLHRKGFLQADAAARVAVVADMAKGESDPKRPVERFFKTLKGAVADSYYKSRIGIHEDAQYKGNSYANDYVGYMPDEDLVLPNNRKQEGW